MGRQKSIDPDKEVKTDTCAGKGTSLSASRHVMFSITCSVAVFAVVSMGCDRYMNISGKTVEIDPKNFNQYDMEISVQLEAASEKLQNRDLKSALDLFTKVTRSNPLSVHSWYGLALVYDKLSVVKQSNTLSKRAIETITKALTLPAVSNDLFIKIATKKANLLAFLGMFEKEITLWEMLISKFPGDTTILNSLGTAHCYNEKFTASKMKAKQVFQQVLDLDPKNSYAQAHLGFVMAIYERDPETASKLLVEALGGDDRRILDTGKFYNFAGDALYRIGKPQQAARVFEQGAKRGVFLSKYQRSTYNVDSLTARPWWTLSELPVEYQRHLRNIKSHWTEIRDEGLSLMDSNTGLFKSEDENLKATGVWKQFTLFKRGKEIREACSQAPITCQLIRPFTDAAFNKRGQVKFSLLLPGTKVWPHTGPTNCRLRPHLGLQVPRGAGIKVAGDTRSWKDGEFIVFDDSFEHEVWHNGTKPRLILIADIWHPDLTNELKKSLHSI